MTRTSFLVGISAIAFAAGANAQTTTTNGDNTNATTGNRVVVSCTTGNSCSVTQSSGNTFNSTGSANAGGGANNSSSVTQTGVRQFAENRGTGDYNRNASTQFGFNNSVSISQTGSVSTANAALGNSATVTQGDASNIGNNNQAVISQVRTVAVTTAGSANSSTIDQANSARGGANNFGSSTQSGTALFSRISQTDDIVPAGVTANNTQVAASGVTAASNNSATVSQTGRGATATTGSVSNVFQRQSGNTASVALFDGGATATTQNLSNVVQYNSQFQGDGAGGFTVGAPSAANNPSTGNFASVAITGQQNSSRVQQNGVQNTADVSLLNGGPGNTGNTANDPTIGGNNPGTGVALNTGGGAGQPTNRPQGNSSTINQTGRGSYANVSLGGRTPFSNGALSGGAGNISSITQTQTSAGGTQTTLNSTLGATTAPRALAFQRGTLDSVTINQSNNALGGGATGVAGTTQAGSLADVSQLSFNSTTSVTQVGSNAAVVNQGSNREASNANNSATINQTDAGDITTASGGSTGGGFGGGSSGTSTGASRNFTEVAQNGILNTANVRQNAIAATANTFQAIGTRSSQLNVQQGTQEAAGPGANNVTGISTEQTTAQNAATNNTFNTQNVTATAFQTAGQTGIGTVTNLNAAGSNTQATGISIAQSGRNLTATANQSGGTAAPAGGTTGGTNSNNSILIAQANDYNSASVTQTGTGQIATVEQRGGAATTAAGAGGGASAATSATLRNLVTITQSNSGNKALARQTTGVGNSTTAGDTAGVPNDVNFPMSRTGANSAEIIISQSGTGGSATVEQRGRGQYASITQTGTNNVGGILQGEAGTNAVAVLRQDGTGNTYFIVQNTPGQYLFVTQTGAANSVGENSVINGPSGGGNSATTPSGPGAGPAPGAFGGTN